MKFCDLPLSTCNPSTPCDACKAGFTELAGAFDKMEEVLEFSVSRALLEVQVPGPQGPYKPFELQVNAEAFWKAYSAARAEGLRALYGALGMGEVVEAAAEGAQEEEPQAASPEGQIETWAQSEEEKATLREGALKASKKAKPRAKKKGSAEARAEEETNAELEQVISGAAAASETEAPAT